MLPRPKSVGAHHSLLHLLAAPPRRNPRAAVAVDARAALAGSTSLASPSATSLGRCYLLPPIAVDARVVGGGERGKVARASRVAALVGSPRRGLQGKGGEGDKGRGGRNNGGMQRLACA